MSACEPIQPRWTRRQEIDIYHAVHGMRRGFPRQPISFAGPHGEEPPQGRLRPSSTGYGGVSNHPARSRGHPSRRSLRSLLRMRSSRRPQERPPQDGGRGGGGRIKSIDSFQALMVRSREAASRTILHRIRRHPSRRPQARPPRDEVFMCTCCKHVAVHQLRGKISTSVLQPC